MSKVLAVARRELSASFAAPVAYIVIIFFLVITAGWFFFVTGFFAQDTASLRGYFSLWPIVFIPLIPAITMRSWAEERRQGTAEILLTLPAREGELVLGKFLGALALLLVAVALTMPVPLTVAPLGFFDAGQIIGQYVGAILLGCTGLAAGMLLSALSANQISAFLLGVVFLLFITMIGQVPGAIALPGWLASAFQWVSLDYHFDNFRKGVLDTRDALFFIVLTAVFLFINTKVLVLRRFR